MLIARSLTLLVLIAAILAGCGRRMLVQAPFVLTHEGEAAFADTPEAFRTQDMTIFYVTDRAVERETETGPRFGYGRSRKITWGTADVRVWPATTWDNFVTDSTRVPRRQAYRLNLSRVEVGKSIESVGARLEAVDGRLIIPPEEFELYEQEKADLRAALAPWIDQGATDAIVFVHGFRNTFDQAVIRAAEIWHYTGRTMIPIAYTWPAGSGSGLFAYTRDRESSEFTVSHLKMFLDMLASHPQIERIHIVSHSRGADVASTAIRELHMVVRRTDRTVAGDMKIATLVLAAPDLDVDVFNQRFFGELAAMAPARLVIYVSERDSALNLSSMLFRSESRIGELSVDSISPAAQELLTQIPTIELISARVSGFGSRHSYVFDNPSVLSDLVLLLRDGATPGKGRPLEQPVPGVWLITNDYGRTPPEE
ncbi:MAG: alpha/beta hydrolase [Planctomycetota bacterium]